MRESLARSSRPSSFPPPYRLPPTRTMATQQAWMDEERKRYLEEFTSKPQSMTDICNEIRLKSGEQVHKDIIRAIVQITGYGKQHVKDTGLIEPRVLLPDGTLTFTSDFQALVDHFLVELRAGVLFFPKILPNYTGWVDSFWPDRPQWKDDGIARIEIRGGILLMFEDIKTNGVTIDLTGAEVYQSFTTKDCDDCGSSIDAPGDDIVYCDTCHVGHHQSCYNIYPRPGPSDPWKCRVCEASKQASAQSSRKRKSSSTPKKKSTSKNVRPKEENSDYKDHHHIMASSEIQEHGKRRSSLDVALKHGRSQDGRRVVSQPVVATPVAEDSKFLARITSLSRVVHVPEEGPTFRDNTSGENRAFSVKQRSESSTRSIKNPSESTPCPEPRLHHPEIEGTILLTRLKDDNIFRKVLLTDTRDVNTLFKVCAERWPEKFGAGGISRLLYIDDEGHHVEIVKRSSPDYKEFLRMIQRRWYMEGSKEVIQVKVILLAPGENLEL